MSTLFDIVLGILLTVLEAILHAFLSTAGVLALCAALIFVALYTWRHVLAAQRRSAHADNVVSINR